MPGAPAQARAFCAAGCVNSRGQKSWGRGAEGGYALYQSAYDGFLSHAI